MDSNMVMEILSRCSIKTLDQCKSVCKQWNNLTHETSFVQLHSRRTNTISGYFLQGISFRELLFKYVSMEDDDSKNISLDFLPKNIRILAVSPDQGILCFVRQEYRNPRYYVCKPATRQLLPLPNPKLRYHTEKVALVVLASNPMHYKIIRLSKPHDNEWIRDYETKHYHCEVFDSDTWAWQKKDDISLPHNVFLNGSAIFWGGAIHWLASNDTILAFDVGLEIDTIISLPKHMCKNNNHYGRKILTKYKGRLAFICKIQTPECNYDTFEIRVLEDYLLERRFMMGMEGIKKECSYWFHYPIAFSSDDIALMMNGDSVMFYRFPHNVVKKYSFSASEVFAFRSDFEAVDLRASGLVKAEISVLGRLKVFAWYVVSWVFFWSFFSYCIGFLDSVTSIFLHSNR